MPVIKINFISRFHCISGSKITFQSTPPTILQGLTNSVTLRCAIEDSAPSSNIIGKRDVTETTDNVLQLTSVILMKNGLDLASVNTAQDAHVMAAASNVQVSGSVAGTSGRTGYLEMTISDPMVNQTGEFVCEANAMADTGHSVRFSTSIEVLSSAPSMTDVIAFVKELSQKNQLLESKVKDLEATVDRLQNSTDAMVFFNAKISGNPHLTAHRDVVFNVVRDNKGGDYDGSSGYFTCSVPGYYHFSLGCLSAISKSIALELRHNNGKVFDIYGAPYHGYQSASNTATLELAAGDVVHIVTYLDSTIQGGYCNFSGHLIEAI